MTISHSELAHNFANGATEGKTANMFINEDTIYSYGPHFPIAKRIPGGYIVNSDKYSVSTAKHQSRVWDAIHTQILWEAPGCEADLTVRYYVSEVEAALEKIPKSRRFFPWHLERLQENLQKAQAAAKEFELDIQPLYDLIDSKLGREAITRIRKEGRVFEGLLEVFGKAQFFKEEKKGELISWKPGPGVHTITVIP